MKEFLKGTGVNFSDKVTDLVFEFTQGHLFEIHVLCFNLYNCEMEGEVGLQQWNKGLEKGLMYLGNSVFDNYLSISQRERELLAALSYFDKPVELIKIIQKCKELKLDINSISQYARRLVEKKIISNPSRGNYFIEDRLFREYVKNFR
ncbi:hypothetical protein HZC30_07530 [Candidatus Woesearchaeota archaeon]|nr:hypothetical protein [Candidatus Woesearchaeota archaeon]